MKDRTPETKPKIYGPAPPKPASGCMKSVLECVGQVTFAVASLLAMAVKGPLGWLLAAMVVAAGLLSVAALFWLRDQTRW